jgi:hypothetical protein
MWPETEKDVDTFTRLCLLVMIFFLYKKIVLDYDLIGLRTVRRSRTAVRNEQGVDGESLAIYLLLFYGCLCVLSLIVAVDSESSRSGEVTA